MTIVSQQSFGDSATCVHARAALMLVLNAKQLISKYMVMTADDYKYAVKTKDVFSAK